MDWEEFTGLGVQFRYPPMTPLGQRVERNEQQRDDLERVHLSTPDRQELYVEVARFRGITPQDEYANHRPYLEQRFGADAVSELTQATVLDRPGSSYSIGWNEEGRPMERAVRLLQVGRDTFRIIYDPRSELNDQVIATLAVEE